VVVNKEWPAMEQGRASLKAWATLDELTAVSVKIDPHAIMGG
jgi:hypothetical protein